MFPCLEKTLPAVLLFLAPLLAAADDRPRPSYAIAGQDKKSGETEGGFWPQWRGPERTNISRDKGLLTSWPEEGPPLAWKTEGLGTEKAKFQVPRPKKGSVTWSFPVIAGGKLYLRDQDSLLCYDIRAKKDRPRAPDAIFVPTPEDVVDKMLEIAGVKKTDLVVDLGCGDGRIVVAAAKKYRCRAVGYDVDPLCVQLSQDNVRKEKVDNLVTIEQKDIFTLDLAEADVVTLYLLPNLNVKLLPQLKKLKPGARIVSHQFPMAGIRPDRVVRYLSSEDGVEHAIYLWTLPLKNE
jgi:hypothetical protein